MRALFPVLLGACPPACAADEASFVNEGAIPAQIDELWKDETLRRHFDARDP
jgi:hypothetical protein